MKKAVIYTRVSSEEQVTGTSLATQLSDCTAYATRQGFDVANVFTDAGVSAKTADRPALQAAMAYCAETHPDALIVWKIDRLSRNTTDGLILRGKLQQYGTQLMSATEAIGSDATGELVGTLLLSVAQFDNQQRAMRCKRGMAETALAGGWCHKAPAGFTGAKRADGLPVLTWDTPTGRTLANALRGLADGTVTKSQYYDTCARIGIPRGQAAKIPHKEVYAGIIRSALTGGQPVAAAFAGMITEDQRQAILANRRANAPQPLARTDYRGILHCAVCGRPLTSYVSKGHVYYKCPDCHVSARDTGIHNQVQALVESTPLLADILQRVVDIIRSRAKAEYEARKDEQAAIAKRAEDAARRLDKLTDRWLDGQIGDELYERKAAEYRTIVASSNQSKTDTQIDTNIFLTKFQQTIEKLRNPATLLAAVSPAARSKILTILYGKITVSPDKRIKPGSNPATPCLMSALGVEYVGDKTETAADKSAAADSIVLWWAQRSKVLTVGATVVKLCRRLVAVCA